jgi:hypothetical protein
MNCRSRPLIDALDYANICSLCALMSHLVSVSVWVTELGARICREGNMCLKDEGEIGDGTCL